MQVGLFAARRPRVSREPPHLNTREGIRTNCRPITRFILSSHLDHTILAHWGSCAWKFSGDQSVQRAQRITMLERVESTVTIADSCQSRSPGATPKKRTYTQVFSTPVGSDRVKRPLLQSTPESPLHIVSTSSFTQQLRDISRPGLRGVPTFQSSLDASWDDQADSKAYWSRVQGCLTSASWLRNHTTRSRLQVRSILSSTAYANLLTQAQSELYRLVDAGDLIDSDMSVAAVRYIMDRHLVRTTRLLADTARDRQIVMGETTTARTSAKEAVPSGEVAGTTLDSVPPTPPGSDILDRGVVDEASVVALAQMPFSLPPNHESDADFAAAAATNERRPRKRSVSRVQPSGSSASIRIDANFAPWPASGTAVPSVPFVCSTRASHGSGDDHDTEQQGPRRILHNVRKSTPETVPRRRRRSQRLRGIDVVPTCRHSLRNRTFCGTRV